MSILEFKLKTRTPIWTGNAQGKCDRIHETAIVGSLRWWYESLTRGLGGTACDPSAGGCPEEEDRADGSRQNCYCNACQLFGATGMRRQFRLDVSGMTNPVFDRVAVNGRTYELINMTPDHDNRRHGWYLGPGLISNDLRLRFTLLTDADWVEPTLRVLLKFIHKWGAIGAKAHLGYGVVDIQEASGEPLCVTSENVAKFIESATRRSLALTPERTLGSGTTGAVFPSMAFASLANIPLTITNNNYFEGAPMGAENPENQLLQQWARRHESVPIAPAVRNQLRFFSDIDPGMQDRLFGHVRGNERQGSHVGTSFAYSNTGDDDYELRLWLHASDQTAVAVPKLEARFKAVEAWLKIFPKASGNSANAGDADWITLTGVSDVEAMLKNLVS